MAFLEPMDALPGPAYRQLPRTPETWVVENLIPAGGLFNLFGPAKGGKALALDTPIPTPHGWRTMGDLRQGDYVFAPTGNPTKVIQAHPIIENHSCYRVTLAGGEAIIADADHLWTVGKRQWTCRTKMCLATTQQMLDAGVKMGPHRYRWIVPDIDPLQYPPLPSPLPLDPYLLGTWLGDGTSTAAAITGQDREIFEAWRQAGWQVVAQPSNTETFHIGHTDGKGILVNILRQLGVFNNKHVPNLYQVASVNDRLQLLRGLLDTDGSCERGKGVFYDTNPLLADAVCDLAAGLGFHVSKHTKRATLYGKDCGICYRVVIWGPLNPFNLTRKAAKYRPNTLEQHRAIVAIDPIDSVPVRCISVEDPSHAYVAGRTCVATHNSYAALQLAVDVSSGSDNWLSFPVHTTGPVLYIQLDTPRSLWGARLDTVAHDLGLDDSNVFYADASMAPYPFDMPREEIILTQDGRTVKHPCQDWLKRQAEKVKPVLVIVDTLRELHRGDENDSGQMVNVMSALVHSTSPAAVCIISHSRKDNMSVPESERDNLLQDNRGSNYIAGRMDGIMKITPKRITYQSRTIDKHYLKCKRSTSGLWIVDGSEEEAQIRVVLGNKSLTSLAARAEVLSELTGKSIEACRSILRRRQERSEGLPSAGAAGHAQHGKTEPIDPSTL